MYKEARKIQVNPNIATVAYLFFSSAIGLGATRITMWAWKAFEYWKFSLSFSGHRHAANLLINLYSLLSTVLPISRTVWKLANGEFGSKNIVKAWGVLLRFHLLKFLQELNMCSIAPCSVLLSSLIACAPQLWVMDSFTRACNSLGQIDFGSIKTFIANVLHLNLIWVDIYTKRMNLVEETRKFEEENI